MGAAYWTSKVISRHSIDIVCGVVEVEVVGEQPFDATGSVLPLHVNRYWPTTINLFGQPVFAHEARLIANALSLAADRCDAEDAPHLNPVCQHWLPCSCGGAK